MSKGNSAPRHWLSLICWRQIPEKRIIKLVGASSLEKRYEKGNPVVRRVNAKPRASKRRWPGYRIASQGFD